MITDIGSIPSGTNVQLNSGIGQAGLTTNCASWPYTTSYPVYVEPNYEIQVRQVTNGFVLKHRGQEYVFEGAEQLAKFITETLRK